MENSPIVTMYLMLRHELMKMAISSVIPEKVAAVTLKNINSYPIATAPTRNASVISLSPEFQFIKFYKADSSHAL